MIPTLTPAMRRALEALQRGRQPLEEPRPKYVTIRTMLALKRRGLVVMLAGEWYLTDAGKGHS